MHHSHGGWYFHRLPDGSVRMTHQMHLVEHDEFGFVGPKDCEHRKLFAIDQDVTFEPSEWASIIASVSQRGEDAQSFAAAEDLHDGTRGR